MIFYGTNPFEIIWNMCKMETFTIFRGDRVANLVGSEMWMLRERSSNQGKFVYILFQKTIDQFQNTCVT
jgi:hypothetical protein